MVKDGEGDDNVEGKCEAEVREAEDTGCYGSEICGVVRDIALRFIWWLSVSRV
jgi:hypothetical protein